MAISESTSKTRIEDQELLRFLKTDFDRNISSLCPIQGGEHSQAFSFQSGGRNFVVRVDKKDQAFKKDLFAFHTFRSPRLPIPEIVKLTAMPGGYFACISVKAEGSHLHKTSKDKIPSLIPKVLDVFDALEDALLPEGNEFGPFDEYGRGQFPNWKESLLVIEDSPDFPWKEWFQTTCMERETYEFLINQLNSESSALPELRTLVHGDIGMDNILTDGAEITAVLDWGQARYGDPVFDVAWLNLWWAAQHIADIYRQHREEQGRSVTGFDARLRWYMAWIGLTSLSFYAKSNQPDSYRWLKGRLQQLRLVR